MSATGRKQEVAPAPEADSKRDQWDGANWSARWRWLSRWLDEPLASAGQGFWMKPVELAGKARSVFWLFALLRLPS